MRHTTWLMISLCVGVVSSTFAAEPAQTSSPPTAKGTPITAEAATANKADAAKAADLAAQAKRLRSAGYKPKVQKNGDPIWCRKEAPLGSRLQIERCSSAEDLDKAALYGQDLTETLRKHVINHQSN